MILASPWPAIAKSNDLANIDSVWSTGERTIGLFIYFMCYGESQDSVFAVEKLGTTIDKLKEIIKSDEKKIGSFNSCKPKLYNI